MGWFFGRKKKEAEVKPVAKQKAKAAQVKVVAKTVKPSKDEPKKLAAKPLPDVEFNLLHPEYKLEPVLLAIEKISELDDVVCEQSNGEATVQFKRDGKSFRAVLSVNREKTGAPTYVLHATIVTDKGKEFFKKERTGLGYSQVEPAAVFVFSQAFSE